MAERKIVGKITGVDFLIDGKHVKTDLAKVASVSEFKGVTHKSTYFTTKPIDEQGVSVKTDEIRMYVPFMGKKGYMPTDEDVRQLFAGEIVHGTGLVSKKGKEYEADFKFDPRKKFKSSNKFSGETDPQFGD